MERDALILRGFIHQRDGRPDLAMRHYALGLAWDPTAPDALHMAAVVAKSLNEPLAALKLFARTRRVAPSLAGLDHNAALGIEVGVRIADEWRRAGRVTEAAELYRAVLVLSPRHGWSLLGLGACLWRGGLHEEAWAAVLLGTMHRVPDGELAPLWPFTTRRLTADGIQLHQTGRPSEARVRYRQCLALDPAHYDAVHLLGVSSRRANDIDGAVSWTYRATHLDPAHEDAFFNLYDMLSTAGRIEEGLAVLYRLSERDDARVHTRIGRGLKEAGRWAEAVAAFRRAVACAPGEVANLHQLADMLARTEDSAAEALLHRVVQADPLQSNAYHLLFKISLKRREYATSSTMLGKTKKTLQINLILDPGRYDFLSALGTIMMAAGYFEKGVDTLHRALRIQKGDEQIFHNLATGLRALSRLEEAFEAFDAGAAVASDPSHCWSRAAEVAVMIDRLDLAEDRLRRVVKIAPHRSNEHIWLHYVILRRGRREEALRFFREWLETDPDSVGALLGLGTIMLDDDPVMAWRHFLQANQALVTGRSGGVITPWWIPAAFEGVSEATLRLGAVRRDETVKTPMTLPPEEGTIFMPFRVLSPRTLTTLPADGSFHPPEGARDILARPIADDTGPVSLEPLLGGETANEVLARNFLREWRRRNPEVMESRTLHGGNDVMLRYEPGYLPGMFFQGRRQRFVISENGGYIEDGWSFDEIALATTKDRKRVLFPIRSVGPPELRCRIDDAVSDIDEAACFLGGFHAFHYGCWLTEILPKLGVYDSLPETRGLPLILSAPLEELPPFVGESLRALDIPPERLRFLDRPTHRVATLFQVLKTDRFPRAAAIEWVREKLLARLEPAERPPPRRLFLSRRDASQRNIVNIREFQAVLDAFGFTEIVGGDLNLMEKVATFADAEAVIGVNGAGMANVIFAPADTLVVEIGALNYFSPDFGCMSRIVKQRYHRVFGVMEGPDQDICVPIEALRRILSRNLPP